ncbi:MAG: TonB-dependent receptor plug domain-containing protein [Bacteroidota bacterium]
MIRLKDYSCLMKNLLIAGLLLLTFPSLCQPLIINDTIRIKEVVISSRPVTSDLPGFTSADLDAILLEKIGAASLSDLLTISSRLFIKSYGSGGAATSSIRGTGASHTTVSWNGINISNPMLGQTDFSLINAGMIDNVRISMGGSSAATGNGAIGGMINLENRPDWQNGTILTINPGAGSFGRFFTIAGLQTGNSRMQAVTRASYDIAENNYPYLNAVTSAEPVMESRINSQFTRKNFLQEIYMKDDRDMFSARIWYQSADRNLPGSILIQSGTEGEKQYDESLRSMFSYDSDKGVTGYFIKGAWIFNRLDYSNPQASIESVNCSNSFVLKGGFERKILKGTTLRAFINEELNLVRSNNYGQNASASNTSLTVVAERKAGNRLGASLLIRETLDNAKLLIPDFSLGIEFRAFPGEDHFLRSGISRTSRIPSMNDRWWYPGGNDELRNEYEYTIDLGYKIFQEFSSSLKFKAETGFFRNIIKDMIQWHPGEYSYWTADNLSKINTSGFESSLSLAYSFHTLKIVANAGYTYSRAVSAGEDTGPSAGNQLMYIPEHQAEGTVYAESGNFYSLWISSFTGRRYITTDNSGYLPGYSISSIVCGARLPFKDNQFDLNFRIDNIFNERYESIAYYPQPGRSFHVSLIYKLNKIKK